MHNQHICKKCGLYVNLVVQINLFRDKGSQFLVRGLLLANFLFWEGTFMYLLIILFLLATAFLLFISKIMPSIFEFIFGLIKTVFVHIGSLIVSIFKLVINFIKVMMGFSTSKNVDFDKVHYYF